MWNNYATAEYQTASCLQPSADPTVRGVLSILTYARVRSVYYLRLLEGDQKRTLTGVKRRFRVFVFSEKQPFFAPYPVGYPCTYYVQFSIRIPTADRVPPNKCRSANRVRVTYKFTYITAYNVSVPDYHMISVRIAAYDETV